MRRARRSWTLMVAALLGLALLLAACPEEEVGDEPEPDPDVEDPVEDEEPEEPVADPDEPMGPEVTLTLAHGFAPAHEVHANVLEPFAEQVHEATDGTVEIEIVTGGALGPPDGTYENVVAGGQDLGWSLQGYTPGRFPITQIIEAPFLFESATDGTEALWTLYQEFPELQEEYGDVKVIGLWSHEPGDLWVSEGPVEQMEDLQGRTLRAPGPMQFDLLNELGAVPEGMPAHELFDALERGVLDGLMIGEAGMVEFDLYELVDAGVRCRCYVAAMFLTMNQQVWDNLSPEQQAAIDEVAGESVAQMGADAYDVHYAARWENRVEDAGIDMLELHDDADELERWQEAGQAVIDQWIEEREAEGVPAQEMYDRLLELADEG